MSRTTRWWQKPHMVKRYRLDEPWYCRYIHSCLNYHNDACEGCFYYVFIPLYKEDNPYGYRHERKVLRVRHHRKYRVNNKIRLKKHLDFEPETRTNGWLTY